VAAHTEPATLLDDPVTFFGGTHEAMHAFPRERLAELQRAALSARFAEMRERVPMLARLADHQGVSELTELEHVVPLLFEHTMYKSYPLALLEGGRFDMLTGWLDRLTSIDLSGADVSGCDSIDVWLDALVEQSGVDVAHTSGTSGTMSFFPWSERDLRMRYEGVRRSYLPDLEPERPVHYIGPVGRHRARDYGAEAFSRGHAELVHTRGSRPSADLLWLAARLRLAAVRGDATRVQVPPALLARRDELRALQARTAAADHEWIAEVQGLQGETVSWSSFVGDMFDLASSRDDRWSFGPGSALVLAGGLKGRVLPDDWEATIARFVDLEQRRAYGMAELGGFCLLCEHGRYHVPPWLIPFVLDPETSALLPRSGVQTGRGAFFDLLSSSHWGGLITGDELEIAFDVPCPCGARSSHIAPTIERLSAKRGGDDKITCTATPEAHAEAMEFLVGY
jgi:hypothetical protein